MVEKMAMEANIFGVLDDDNNDWMKARGRLPTTTTESSLLSEQVLLCICDRPGVFVMELFPTRLLAASSSRSKSE